MRDVGDAPWSFFLFAGGSCQLHPNPPGGAPASLHLPRTLSGQTFLETGIAHAGRDAAPIRFAVTLAAPDGTPLAHATQTLAAGGVARLSLPLPGGCAGPHRVILETAMTPGAAHNRNAWARFLDPALV